MQNKCTSRRIIRHISFSEKDDALVRQRADSVGMPVTSYIRSEAMYGAIKVYDTVSIYNHTIAINDIASCIKEYINRPHSNRVLYEADIERIEDAIDELIKIERSLLSIIRQELS